MYYDDIATALLAEVGLSWADVFYTSECGKGLGRYHGVCHIENGHPTIGLSFRKMDVCNLFCLAHECAHVKQKFWNTSIKEYVQEYEAELYALRTMEIFGLQQDFMVIKAKKYVRHHCGKRELLNWPWLSGGPYAWNWNIIEWCGYRPVMGLPDEDWGERHRAVYEQAKRIMGTWDESAQATKKAGSKAAFFRGVGEKRGRYMSA